MQSGSGPALSDDGLRRAHIAAARPRPSRARAVAAGDRRASRDAAGPSAGGMTYPAHPRTRLSPGRTRRRYPHPGRFAPTRAYGPHRCVRGNEWRDTQGVRRRSADLRPAADALFELRRCRLPCAIMPGLWAKPGRMPVAVQPVLMRSMLPIRGVRAPYAPSTRAVPQRAHGRSGAVFDADFLPAIARCEHAPVRP